MQLDWNRTIAVTTVEVRPIHGCVSGHDGLRQMFDYLMHGLLGSLLEVIADGHVGRKAHAVVVVVFVADMSICCPALVSFSSSVSPVGALRLLMSQLSVWRKNGDVDPSHRGTAVLAQV
jgi:hypothetical protein